MACSRGRQEEMSSSKQMPLLFVISQTKQNIGDSGWSRTVTLRELKLSDLSNKQVGPATHAWRWSCGQVTSGTAQKANLGEHSHSFSFLSKATFKT